jgi:hypothetical protein
MFNQFLENRPRTGSPDDIDCTIKGFGVNRTLRVKLG